MEHIEFSKAERKGFITLNRPEKRNALSPRMISELKEAFTLLEKDPEVKIIILKSAGKIFCSGADLDYLRQLQEFSYEENIADSNSLKELFYQIYTLEKIVIAQVQGHALAGGCGLATVCDFVYAVPEVRFGYTEVKIGFVPAIVMSFLLRKVGAGHARQMLLGGGLISAAHAREIGLVSEVIAPDDLETTVVAFADHIIRSNSGEAMSTTKRMLSRIQTMPIAEALSYGVEMNAKARSTEDCRKGISSFLNKEEIRW